MRPWKNSIHDFLKMSVSRHLITIIVLNCVTLEYLCGTFINICLYIAFINHITINYVFWNNKYPVKSVYVKSLVDTRLTFELYKIWFFTRCVFGRLSLQIDLLNYLIYLIHLIGTKLWRVRQLRWLKMFRLFFCKISIYTCVRRRYLTYCWE